MKVGIIGSGLQCRRRIESLVESNSDEVVLVAGNHLDSLKIIAEKYRVQITSNIEEIFNNPLIEAVIICTPPSSHTKYITKCIENKKKVLVEKPISQTVAELVSLKNQFGSDLDKYLRCGFNHRFHPGIQKMKGFLESGRIGAPIFARAIYGICARNDYPEEWRADPRFAAGGQFIEQGSHLIDLFNWLLGTPKSIYCKTSNLIFKDQTLEDGGMAILSFQNGMTVQMHTTLGQWHNRFEFEVYGELGFLKVEGLGNTYGTEKFIFGERDESAPFSQETFEFRGADKSWRDEWESFKLSFTEDDMDIASFNDGLLAMRVAEAGYKSNEISAAVEI